MSKNNIKSREYVGLKMDTALYVQTYLKVSRFILKGSGMVYIINAYAANPSMFSTFYENLANMLPIILGGEA